MPLFENKQNPSQMPPPSKGAFPGDPLEIARNINAFSRKMRLNEERIIGLRKKMQLIEHNMIEGHKKLLAEIKFLNKDVGDIKREFDELKDKVLGFGKELQRCAKKEDVDVLEKYINMWEPVNFVTRREVEKMINERFL
jgi:hypothetical protein